VFERRDYGGRDGKAGLRGKERRGVLETLMIGDTELSSIVVDEPSYAISDPFVLELIKQ